MIDVATDCVPSEQTVMHQTTEPQKLLLALISRQVPSGIPEKKGKLLCSLHCSGNNFHR